MKQTPSTTYLRLALGALKDVRIRYYLRKIVGMGAAIGYGAWQEITDRVAAMPEISSKVEYEPGTLSVDKHAFAPRGIQYMEATYLNTNTIAPNRIPGLTLWLEADNVQNVADGGAVSEWLDLSGNGNHATQSTAANKPTYKVGIVNGKPVLRFDSNDNLTLGDKLGLEGRAPFTFMVLVNPSANPTNNRLIQKRNEAPPYDGWLLYCAYAGTYFIRYLNNNGSVSPAGPPLIPGRWYLLTVTYDGSTMRLFLNGAEQGAGLASTYSMIDNASSCRIGATEVGPSPLQGDHAAILMYNRSLTDAERVGLEYFYADKYALSLTKGLTPDMLSGLGLWLKADAIAGLANGDLVSLWQDSSGNGFNGSNTGSNRPTYVTDAINGLPAVRFAPANNTALLIGGGLSIGDNCTVFFVCRSNSDTVRATLLGQDNAANAVQFEINASPALLEAIIPGVYTAQAQADTCQKWFIYEYARNGASPANNAFYKNGSWVPPMLTAANAYSGQGQKVLGRRFNANQHWDGDIAEVIIYTRTLSEAERQGVEKYLKDKYAISVARSMEPNALPGLSLWLKADAITGLADGAAVTTWTDSSPSGYNVTQANAAMRPLYKTNVQNGLPGVRFDGTDDYLYGGDVLEFLGTAPFTIMVMAKLNTVDTTYRRILAKEKIAAPVEGWHLYYQTASTRYFERQTAGTPTGAPAGAVPVSGAVYSLAVTFDGGRLRFFQNGAEQSVGAGGVNVINDTATNLTVGASDTGAYPFSGDLFEVIVYNRVLSMDERQQIETYLQDKWLTKLTAAKGEDLIEMKVEAELVGATDKVPLFSGFVDRPGADAEELTDKVALMAYALEDLGNRIPAELVSCKPVKVNADGAGNDGLILPTILDAYVTDANISGYVLKPGVHTLTYEYNGGTRRAKLDAGAWKTLSNGNNTIGNVDNSTGDTERITLYCNLSTMPSGASAYVDDLLIINYGAKLPRRWYKDSSVRSLLTKLYRQLGATSQVYDTLEFSTYNGAKRVSYLDTPPGNDGVVIGAKDAIETDGTDLFISVDAKVYRREFSTGEYKLLATIPTGSVEKLMYNSRNGHLWIYGSGNLYRLTLSNLNLSAGLAIGPTHYSVQLYDYQYTSGAYKYGVLYTEESDATDKGRFKFVDGSVADGTALSATQITTGTLLGYTTGNGIRNYFMYLRTPGTTSGAVRFRVYNNAGLHAYREYTVNASGVWTDGGEKTAGIYDYRVQAYNQAEGVVYYFAAQAGTGDLLLQSHTDASTGATTVLDTNDATGVAGTAYYSPTDATIYLTMDLVTGLTVYSAIANVATAVHVGILTRLNQMVYANSRLYLLDQNNATSYVNYEGVKLYQYGVQVVPMVPMADFEGLMVTPAIRKLLSPWQLIGKVSVNKQVYVFRRADSNGTPVTSGATLSVTISEARNVRKVREYSPKAELVSVSNGSATVTFNGVAFNVPVFAPKRVVTIDSPYIPTSALQDLAYQAWQFFKVGHDLYAVDLGLIPYFHYELFDKLSANIVGTQIPMTLSGPIYGVSYSSTGNMKVEVLI
jgi:hypothetical protein